jgi:uncharacterized protein (DUF952 family)
VAGLANPLLHICPRSDWDARDAAYRSASLATEGFIHCSRPEQVVATAARFFHGQRGLVLLVIDPDRVAAEIRDELAENGQMFPHIYGPLNADAVVAVLPFEPAADGGFALPVRLGP